MSTSFLKKYEVIQRVGVGSFSQVLKCQDRITGFFYAGKRLKRIYQSDPLPGKVTLIVELMEMSLYEMMKNQKGHIMPEKRVKMYLCQLLRGLGHLHKHGVFHRDIKPENILIKGDIVKLADLGSIRGIYSRLPYTEYISTRWYRSPECLLTTGFYGPKMDIWALGCVFYELLTLKPLFPGYNEVDQITKIHTILGSPHAKIMAKFRRHKYKHCEYLFPNKGGTGLDNLLPNVSRTGQEFIKLMLVYDPETRSNVWRLMAHPYVNDLRADSISRQSRIFTSSDSRQWHNNPTLLSYITSEKHRRCDPLNTCQTKIMVEPLSNDAPNVIASSSINSSARGKTFLDKGDSTILLSHKATHNTQKSWRVNVYSTTNREINQMEFPPTNMNFSMRSSLMKCNGRKTSEETEGIAQQTLPDHVRVPVSSQHNSICNDFYPSLKLNDKKDKFEMEKNCFTLLPEIMRNPEHHYSAMPVVSASQQKITQADVGKRKTQLTTISENQITVRHMTSFNVKSLAKKMAKHETMTKSLGKLISTKKVAVSIRRLRGK